MMRALVSTPDGTSPAEVKLVEEPAPGSAELLLEVRAASLNRGELGLLPARPGWRPGQDVSGLVARAAADGSGPHEGARVVALVDQGGWAERVAAPTNRTAVIPNNVEFGAAATLGVAGLTALRALRVGGPLLGARVLVTGASGGVGRFAVQLAALGGAVVTASAANRERSRGLEELGASRIVHEGEELEGPFDLAMEGVGGSSLQRSLRALAPGGVIAFYGVASSQPSQIALGDFSGRAGAQIQGFFVYATGTETFGRDLEYLARLMGEGKLRPQVGLEVSWTELGKAMTALRDRKVNGKVVLRLD